MRRWACYGNRGHIDLRHWPRRSLRGYWRTELPRKGSSCFLHGLGRAPGKAVGREMGFGRGFAIPPARPKSASILCLRRNSFLVPLTEQHFGFASSVARCKFVRTGAGQCFNFPSYFEPGGRWAYCRRPFSWVERTSMKPSGFTSTPAKRSAMSTRPMSGNGMVRPCSSPRRRSTDQLRRSANTGAIAGTFDTESQC
jgi:hypothetical protein